MEKSISETAIHDLETHTSEIKDDIGNSLEETVLNLELLAEALDAGLAESSLRQNALFEAALRRSGELTSLLLLDRMHAYIFQCSDIGVTAAIQHQRILTEKITGTQMPQGLAGALHNRVTCL